MNLKLYGICFKMRGGPDVLTYTQSGTPIPVDLMGQVMNQMDTVTKEELDFARKLDEDWKKAFNERAPMTMTIVKGGGYDITCDVPNELLDTVRILTGKENEKLVEEYTAAYLKEVCGVDADIVSVDVEGAGRQEQIVQEAPASGFDLSDLGADPEGPALEDITDIDMDIPVDGFTQEAEQKPAVQAAVQEKPADQIPVQEEPMEEDLYEEEEGMDGGYDQFEEEGIPVEEGYPEDEGFPEEAYEEDASEQEPEEMAAEEAVEETAAEDPMQNAVVGIYKEMVGNIKDRKLDERLGLNIGGK